MDATIYNGYAEHYKCHGLIEAIARNLPRAMATRFRRET